MSVDRVGDLHDRLRRYGRDFELAVASTPSVVRLSDPSTRGRRPGRALVAVGLAACVAAVLMLGVVVLDHDDSSKITSRPNTPSGWVHHDGENVTVSYPSSWKLAPAPLMADIDGGREILSLSTGSLVPGNDVCPNGDGAPVNAINALGPTDALVTIQERDGRLLYPPRPTFPPDDPIASIAPISCATLAGEHWYFAFDDQGRSFEAYAVLGPDASAETRSELIEIFNAIVFTPRPVPTIPNDVEESLYASQASGATTMVMRPELGYHQTALRVEGRICIDVRPLGAPSGPQFCDIPANAQWPAPVLASVVTLNGNRYLLGVATEDVTALNLDGTTVGTVRHLPYPTIQFFAEPLEATGPAQLRYTRGGTTEVIDFGP